VQNVYFIVGDDYANFAVNEGVMTASHLLSRLGSTHDWQPDDTFIIGQGISQEIISLLTAGLKAQGLHNIAATSSPAQLHLTHKHYVENVLISQPRAIGPGHYEMDFLFSRMTDRLSDHVTGQHVGAMLMMEAARQAGVALLELEFAKAFDKCGMTVQNFNCKFNSYVFPIPVTIDAYVEGGRANENCVNFLLTVKFLQAGKTVCEFTMDGGLFDRNHLDGVEAVKAKRVVATTRQLIQQQTLVAEVN